MSPLEQQLMATIERFGLKRLQKRRKEVQRLLHENGATHNVFDPEDTSRSWQFDPIPLIISGEEWAQLEAGLIQRAKLLDLILADIYGPRLLVEQGLLPAELLFAHQGFLWPCVGLLPPGQTHLQLYSVSLARGQDGRFWVLDDYTQPPFGSGYALENRIVMSRGLPQLFKDFQVHRLAMYFRALRNNLTQLAPHNRSDPLIVVLTPGPENQNYFEHSFLAAYLGFPLVQGGDLIVRDGSVWLKSVGGLRQVDVILSRLNDALCDPLVLRGDSQFGVPGLLEALRRGNVAIANPIGSSVLENPALMAFLPTLARQLLGEELLIPSVATWWCGQPRECAFVLDNLEQLVVKPIHPLPNVRLMVPWEMSAAEIEIWRERIIAAPHLYVGQEITSLAASPAFVGDQIEPRTGILTTYLTAQEGSFVALPGGLTRINASRDSLSIPQQQDWGCKDTWVLTDELDKQVNFWRQADPNQLIKPLLMSLPSRAAENLFWAGRYAERTEATARLLRSVLGKLRDLDEYHDPDDRHNLELLLQALTEVTGTFPGFAGPQGAENRSDPRPELLSLAGDPARIGSLRSSLASLARAAYPVRDLLPEDAWRVVDHMQHKWRPRVVSTQIGSGRLYENINDLILKLAAFSGLTGENMSRETAWQLLNIGRRLERAQNLLDLLLATLVPRHEDAHEAPMLEAVLSICNSLVVFRRRYRSFMQLSTVLELLLKDENYPRALAYQLQQLQAHIGALPHPQPGDQTGRDEQLISETLDALRAKDLRQLIQLGDSDNRYPLLERFLGALKQQLEQLSDTLVQLYFSPTQVLQQMGAATRQEPPR